MNDEELIKEVKRGDVLAFEKLVLRYEGKLMRYSRKYLKEEKDAEEVVQDSLFKVYKNLYHFDIKKRFAPYIYKITKNTIMDLYRKKKESLPLFDSVIGIEGEDMYEKVHKKEETGRLHQAIGELKEIYKKVIKMYYFEEMSYKKMQNKLGVPLNTVRTLLKRAKMTLAKKIKK